MELYIELNWSLMYYLTFLSIRKKEFFAVLCCATSSEVPSRCVCSSSNAFSRRNIQTAKRNHLSWWKRKLCFMSEVVLCTGFYSLWYVMSQLSCSIQCYDNLLVLKIWEILSKFPFGYFFFCEGSILLSDSFIFYSLAV